MNYNPNDQFNSRKKSPFKKILLAIVIIFSLSIYGLAFFVFLKFVKPIITGNILAEKSISEMAAEDGNAESVPDGKNETNPLGDFNSSGDIGDENSITPEENADNEKEQGEDIKEDSAVSDITVETEPVNFDEVWDADDSEKVFYNEENTPTYIWATHATTIYAKLEFGYEDKLIGHIITDSDVDDWKSFLDNAWSISDRDSAKETIERMTNHGHKEKFREYIKSDKDVQTAIDSIATDFGSLNSVEDTDQVTEEYLKSKGIRTLTPDKVRGAALAYSRFGQKGLDGYDYLRLIRVTYISFKCGYLSQNEYMKLVEIFNDRLRVTYSNFKEIHETYYYGEMFRGEYGTVSNEEKNQSIRDAIAKIEKEGLYETIDKDYDMVDNHDDEYYKMVGKAEESNNIYESDIELSDNLEDYTFSINGRVYKLPLSYDEIVDGGFTPDTDGNYLVPAGESYYFKGSYMGNEYSKLDFAVLNDTDHDVKLADIPIILVNGNQFRWNQYRKYPYKIAGGIEIEYSTIDDVEKLYGPLNIPEDSTEDALGTTLYYYEYNFDSGWYRFIVQPNGEIAGIRMCKFLEK